MVDTVQGPFTIYDWKKYMGFDGYCPGQDDVSMSLELYGSWEASDWDRVRTSEWEPGRVFDFGSQIGWYAITLGQLGHEVICVDADPTNCEVLAINARNRRMSLDIRNAWVADVSFDLPDVRFIKSDVEGHEDEVMSACKTIIAEQRPVMLLECSPEFASYYPDLIRYLQLLGYESSMAPEDLKTQANVWFT